MLAEQTDKSYRQLALSPNPLMEVAVGSATGASDEEATGPKLQMSLVAQFSGTFSGSDQFQSVESVRDSGGLTAPEGVHRDAPPPSYSFRNFTATA
jgi:hypothetical protein